MGNAKGMTLRMGSFLNLSLSLLLVSVPQSVYFLIIVCSSNVTVFLLSSQAVSTESQQPSSLHQQSRPHSCSLHKTGSLHRNGRSRLPVSHHILVHLFLCNLLLSCVSQDLHSRSLLLPNRLRRNHSLTWRPVYRSSSCTNHMLVRILKIEVTAVHIDQINHNFPTRPNLLVFLLVW